MTPSRDELLRLVADAERERVLCEGFDIVTSRTLAVLDRATAAIRAMLEQKPVAEVRRADNGSVWIDWFGKSISEVVGEEFYALPVAAPAQPSAEWLDEAMRLADNYASTNFRDGHALRPMHSKGSQADRAALREHLEKLG